MGRFPGRGRRLSPPAFAASATDVGFELRVRDTATGRVRQYVKTAGTPARALVDLSAFPRACQP